VSPRIRQLDLTLGDLVEVNGRRYEVVPDRMGGVTLEPPITPTAELEKGWGTSPASAEDFERLTADYPTDDEGVARTPVVRQSDSGIAGFSRS